MCIIQSAAFVAVIVILTVLAVKSIPIYLHISRVSRYLVECRISPRCSAMCTAVLQTHRNVRIECREANNGPIIASLKCYSDAT